MSLFLASICFWLYLPSITHPGLRWSRVCRPRDWICHSISWSHEIGRRTRRKNKKSKRGKVPDMLRPCVKARAGRVSAVRGSPRKKKVWCIHRTKANPLSRFNPLRVSRALMSATELNPGRSEFYSAKLSWLGFLIGCTSRLLSA